RRTPKRADDRHSKSGVSPKATRCPCTALFRSGGGGAGVDGGEEAGDGGAAEAHGGDGHIGVAESAEFEGGVAVTRVARWRVGSRSEEHTSELQSRENHVCRLLLEKKQKQESTE